MKTIISVFVLLVVVFTYTKKEMLQDPKPYDYSILFYKENKEIALKKQVIENLKIQIQLEQFKIKNSLGIE